MTSRDYLGAQCLESDPRLKKAVEILASKEPGVWTDTCDISGTLGLSSHEMGEFTRKFGKKGFMWIDTRLNPAHTANNPRQIRIVLCKYLFVLDCLSRMA